MSKPSRIILISLCGKSPAVITEAVWALHEQKGICVDEVHALTTTEGKTAIMEQLLSATDADADMTMWQRLAAELSFPSDRGIFGEANIHLFPTSQLDFMADTRDPNALQDIGSYIYSFLRDHTSDDSQQVVVSLAGGTKVMTALMAVVFSMVSREQDLLCHVLVNYPFDVDRLSPKFYFPDKRIGAYSLDLRDGTLQQCNSEDVILALVEIPVILGRNLIFQKTGMPKSYSATMKNIEDAVEKIGSRRTLTLCAQKKSASLDGDSVRLNPEEFDALFKICRSQKSGVRFYSIERIVSEIAPEGEGGSKNYSDFLYRIRKKINLVAGGEGIICSTKKEKMVFCKTEVKIIGTVDG